MANRRPLEAGKEDEEGEEAAEAPARAVSKKPVVPEELRAGNRAARVSPTAQEQASALATRQKAAPQDTKSSPCQTALTRHSPRPQSVAPRTPRPQPPAPPVPQAPASPSHRPEASASPSSSGVNLFANDGSFLEMFKKKMEKSAAGKEEPRPSGEGAPEPEKRKPIGFVGKRRGGAKLALKTGIVAKKPKNDGEEVLSSKGGAWAQYMAEVKKYKAHQCSDDDKTRPLVK